MHVDDCDLRAATLRPSRGCFLLAKEINKLNFNQGERQCFESLRGACFSTVKTTSSARRFRRIFRDAILVLRQHRRSASRVSAASRKRWRDAARMLSTPIASMNPRGAT
jgi:hypothetical protein